ncbi:hypothetical protein AC579_8993 [Pseudocercospora musae]|uniref:Uncharacterized protein n=1 Tax=Pseudocercospora musae TaxID=113226 RepID=A0A139I804_9PEZI|nr:hypothetical protein AC579_8993 [Pseudocercospora musae]
MPPTTPFQVQSGRISRATPKRKPRNQRIRSHKLNLDRVKEEALSELFASTAFLSSGEDVDQNEAADIALPDNDLADEIQDLGLEGPGLGTYAYEDTAAAVMEIEWSEDIEEEDGTLYENGQ